MSRTWVIDTEGSGAKPNEIIELGIIEMISNRITGRAHSWRFKPKMPVTYQTTRIHGITNRDLEGCPTIEEHVDEIRGIIGSDAIAGHSVHIELDLLQSVMPEWVPSHAYDTLRIVRKLYPEQTKHNLGHMSKQLMIAGEASRLTGKGIHAALYDAALCALIIQKEVQPLDLTEKAQLLTHSDILPGRVVKAEQQAAKTQKQAVRNRAKRLGRVN